MAAPHSRTRVERARRLARIARLDRLGYNQTEIAEKLGCRSQAISVAMRKIRRHYQEMMDQDTKVIQGQKATQLMDIFRESLKAWQFSWGKMKQSMVEEMLIDLSIRLEANPDASEIVEVLREKGLKVQALPNPRSEFLQTMLACVAQWRAIYGLDAPKDVNMRHSGTLNWDLLVKAVPAEAVEDKIAKELEAIAMTPVVDQVVDQPEDGTKQIPYGLKEDAGNGERRDGESGDGQPDAGPSSVTP